MLVAVVYLVVCSPTMPRSASSTLPEPNLVTIFRCCSEKMLCIRTGTSCAKFIGKSVLNRVGKKA